MHPPVEALFHGWEQFCVTFEPQERMYLTSMGILVSGILLQGVVEGGKSFFIAFQVVERLPFSGFQATAIFASQE